MSALVPAFLTRLRMLFWAIETGSWEEGILGVADVAATLFDRQTRVSKSRLLCLSSDYSWPDGIVTFLF